MRAALAGLCWTAANAPGWARFRASLASPEITQEAILRRYLGENAQTAFGRAHRFASIRSVAEYMDRVPLSGAADYAPWVDRIAAGEPAVLTRSRVRALETTGGTTAAKRIPYTLALQAELRRAVAPWIFDLVRQDPALARGRSYWAITPVSEAAERTTAAGVRVGFEDDAAYLGGVARRLVEATLAVPAAVRHVPDLESFRYATLLFLLRARDLALVSVWHPSFLGLLLDALPRHWDRLVEDVRRGTLRPPRVLDEPVHARLRKHLRADPRRADELAHLGPSDPAALWPGLRLVSCWGDAHAALHADGLARALPGVRVQPKGLLATEAVVSIPFDGARPLALRSHFFEFLGERGGPRLAHELEPGGVYSVVVTTGGGLYRYRLEDRVEVTGFVRATPSLRFLGKEGNLSDRVGEKLREDFVAAALAHVFAGAGVSPRFALLAPDGRSYVLYVERDTPLPAAARLLQEALERHPDYAYACRLGQLDPVRVFRIAGGGLEAYLERARSRGQRLGDVKPLALSPLDGWSAVFPGAYAEEPEKALLGR
jgi:hypothetical protein